VPKLSVLSAVTDADEAVLELEGVAVGVIDAVVDDDGGAAMAGLEMLNQCEIALGDVSPSKKISRTNTFEKVRFFAVATTQGVLVRFTLSSVRSWLGLGVDSTQVGV
jgi:hypothetical protein